MQHKKEKTLLRRIIILFEITYISIRILWKLSFCRLKLIKVIWESFKYKIKKIYLIHYFQNIVLSLLLVVKTQKM